MNGIYDTRYKGYENDYLGAEKTAQLHNSLDSVFSELMSIKEINEKDKHSIRSSYRVLEEMISKYGDF